jgi:hypothetical protein
VPLNYASFNDSYHMWQWRLTTNSTTLLIALINAISPRYKQNYMRLVGTLPINNIIFREGTLGQCNCPSIGAARRVLAPLSSRTGDHPRPFKLTCSSKGRRFFTSHISGQYTPHPLFRYAYLYMMRVVAMGEKLQPII